MFDDAQSSIFRSHMAAKGRKEGNLELLRCRVCRACQCKSGNLRHFSKFLKVLLVKASYTYFRSKYIYFHRRKKGFQLKKLLRMREKNDTHLTSSKASAEWNKQRRQQTNVHNSILDCYSLESSRVCCSEFLLAERHLEWQEWLLIYIRSIAIRWKFARLLFRIFVG